jgi:hypothetical protein
MAAKAKATKKAGGKKAEPRKTGYQLPTQHPAGTRMSEIRGMMDVDKNAEDVWYIATYPDGRQDLRHIWLRNGVWQGDEVLATAP